MSLMSVKDWGQPGHWETNYSSIAVSSDNGENWTVHPETQRPSQGGSRNFQQNAFLKDGGFIYEYGTPPGRGNLGHVSRMLGKDILNLAAYEFWTGTEWQKGDPALAAPIVDNVGELSVAYNQYLGQYLMLTTGPLRFDRHATFPLTRRSVESARGARGHQSASQCICPLHPPVVLGS